MAGFDVATEGHHRDRPVGFLFPGVGDQYAEMASGLYRRERVFREAVDRCAAAARPHLDGRDLRELGLEPLERAGVFQSEVVLDQLERAVAVEVGGQVVRPPVEDEVLARQDVAGLGLFRALIPRRSRGL